MPATATELHTDWEQLQAAGEELAVSLRSAADRLEHDGLFPAANLAETVRDFRHRLETFRNDIDPNCPAEQAASEDRLVYAAIDLTLSRVADSRRMQAQLERVLALRHVDDPEYAPLIACRDDARRLLEDHSSASSQSLHEWQEFVEEKHPLNALLVQVTGSSDLSDEAWAELSERLSQKYGRTLATAVARGRVVFSEVPAVTAESPTQPAVDVASDLETGVDALVDVLPAAGGNAEIAGGNPLSAAALAHVASPATTFPEDLRDPVGPVFEVDIELPVDPDLHAAEVDNGSSFLDTDCPFNPHSPSSSLTLTLASAREKLPLLPQSHVEPAESTPAVVSSTLAAMELTPTSIFDDESKSTARSEMAELNLSRAAEAAEQAMHVPTPLMSADSDAVPTVPTTPVTLNSALNESHMWSSVDQREVPIDDTHKAPGLRETLQPRPPQIIDSSTRDTVSSEATIFEVEQSVHAVRVASVEELAIAATKAEGAERVRLLAELQIALLGNGQFALAYQITRCLEQHRDHTPTALPLWLVRALTLGEHVVFPKGNIALLLQEDFAEFRRELLYRGDRDWGEALGFFLRAAAIRPAVLAPASRGAAMLRAVGIHENLCHLYNYCSRIIRFADHDQENILQLLRPNEYDEPRRQAQQQLLWDIKAWQRTPLPAGSPEVELLVQQLLDPILVNQTSAIGWVRQEVSRLSGEVQTEREENTSRPRYMPARLHLVGEGPRRRLREALQFADRWLALQGPKPMSIIDAFVPPSLQELRNSILDRHESAIVELLACDQAQESRFISAGISACRRAMQNVHDLFDPRISPPNEEADPRHILNGVLLKVPHISLNARWESELELPALETELLEFLSKPEPSWLDVLEMHGQLHDHAATERLLELDVWGSAAHREELRSERHKQVSECRAALERETVELTSLLRELCGSGLIDPQVQASLESRLERLSKGIEKVLDFSPIESQFSQIRNMLERRRQSDTARAGGSDSHSSGMPGLRKPPRANSASASELAHRDSVWVMDFN